MSKILDSLNEFVAYAALLKDDEKGEAQVFCDRLFKAFGHAGYKEAGATLEERIKKGSGKGTSFADLVWKPRLLIEMKKGGEKLHLHYQQAFDYWLNAVPNRPRYVILCNFNELWIYDFDRQLHDPVDVVALKDLPTRYTALNFLFPDERKPVFNNDREDVSRKTADDMASLFKALTRRKKNPIPRAQAQRFILQMMVAMFAEDIDLLPRNTVISLIDDCLNKGQSSYDLFNGLFSQMNSPKQATAGRFRDVRYFNGGLFSNIEPVELTREELEIIGGDGGAATENWAKINPVIFGTLFQHSMDKEEHHAFGAHFTSEADIQRIVGPTIIKPWTERIDAASRLQDLVEIRKELMNFRVLDPSCGSGNFLYVAYREFQRMIEAGTSKPAPFDIVVVHSFSRFFRDHFEMEFYVRKLAKNGVKLVSITQEMGDDPMHQMMRQIMALFDEYQSKENAKHVLRAMNENARQGFWNGARPPIGYRIVAAEQRGSKTKKKLEIDPLHADTVRLIYRLFLEGDGTSGAMGVKAIATYLNERRFFTRDGGRWGLAQIHAILTRTTYIGEHRFNTRSHKDREKKPESEVAIMAVPPLIERELYDAVQARSNRAILW